MTPAELQAANAALKSQSPLDIVRWGLERSGGRAIVSTNFRPYEAVILHFSGSHHRIRQRCEKARGSSP